MDLALTSPLLCVTLCAHELTSLWLHLYLHLFQTMKLSVLPFAFPFMFLFLCKAVPAVSSNWNEMNKSINKAWVFFPDIVWLLVITSTPVKTDQITSTPFLCGSPLVSSRLRMAALSGCTWRETWTRRPAACLWLTRRSVGWRMSWSQRTWPREPAVRETPRVSLLKMRWLFWRKYPRQLKYRFVMRYPLSLFTNPFHVLCWAE